MIKEDAFRYVVCTAILVVGAIAYVNTFDGGWVWDDASSVLLHKNVQNPEKFFQLFREDQHAFGRGQGNFYRPLVSASFMADFILSYNPIADARPEASYPDIKPLLFHVSNMAWHIAAAMLLFALLARMNAPRFVRAIVPILYVLHPLHTEAVAYISGRADMMSAVFMFLALLCCLRAENSPRPVLPWTASAFCFIAALLSKESSFIYPLLLALLAALRPLPEADSQFAQRRFAFRAVPLGLAIFIMAVYAVLRMTVLKFAQAVPGPDSNFFQRLFETAQAFAFYIKALFWPFHLHMEQTLVGTPAWTALLGLFFFALCLGTVAWAVRAKHARIALGMGWFLLTWLPISGIFPLNAPMAEHWMYVPMAGFWWALAELVVLAIQNRPTLQRAAWIGAAALALFFLALTVQRNQDWHSNERLFRATLKENPASARVLFNLAVTYEDLSGDLPGARRQYEVLLRVYDAQKKAQARPGEDTRNSLMPEEIETHLSLGKVLLRQGQFTQALDHLAPLMGLANDQRFRSHAGAAALNMGRCLLALGEISRADACFRQALTIDPATAPEITNLLEGGSLRQ